MSIDAIALGAFDDTINSTDFTLILFSMPHCPPCRAMTPIIENVMEDQALSDVQIVRFPMERRRRADTNVLEEKFDVDRYPTLHLYKNGELLATRSGYCEEPTIKEFITKHKQ